MLAFSPAVRVTLTVLEVDPAEAVNDALHWFAPTTMDDGTVTRELLLDRDTTTPPAGATGLIVTVQAALPGPLTLAGVQLRLTTCNCCCEVTSKPAVAELPLNSAVKVTLAEAAVACADAVKMAVFCPAFTVTVEGTVTVDLLLDSETVTPPAGAATLRVTVQLAVAEAAIVVGVQLRPVT